jgi:hypothetical protein
MANGQTYNQYTKCVEPANYSGPFLGTTAFWVALTASIAAALAGIFVDPGLVPLGFILMGIAYCRWFLYGRLVCLGGNKCLIGLALEIDTQQDQGSRLAKLDTDISINILLAPSPFIGDPNWLADVPATNDIQGYLIVDQSPVNSALEALHLPFSGEPERSFNLVNHDGTSVLTTAQANALNLPTPDNWQPNWLYPVGWQILDSNDNLQNCTSNTHSQPTLVSPPNWATAIGGISLDGFGQLVEWTCAGPIPKVSTLEVEFEGKGVWDLYLALLVAAGLAAAGTIVGAAASLAPLLPIICGIPVIGWIACILIASAYLISLILGAAALAAAGTGLLIGWSDTSAESQVTSQVGVIHPGSDVLFVMGTWILDSGHQGWNELHPVLFAQIIDQVSQADLLNGTPWQNLPQYSEAILNATLQGWCGLATTATAQGTIELQGLPQNQWTIHPLVDGCAPATVIF